MLRLRNLYSRRLVQYTVCNKYCTEIVAKEEEEDDTYEKQMKTLKSFAIKPKTHVKQPQRMPFMKSIMGGTFDAEILTYPEFNSEQTAIWEQNMSEIKAHFNDPDLLDTNNLRGYLKFLGNSRLLGLKVPQLIGGRDFTLRESICYYDEFAKMPFRMEVALTEHVVINALHTFGSTEQKVKYLQPLIAGDIVGTFCCLNPTSQNAFDDTGSHDAVVNDNLSWTVNGESKMVINGSTADLFLIAAQTGMLVREKLQEPKYTFFLIERDCGYITSQTVPTDFPDIQFSNIILEEAVLDPSNILGKINCANEMLNTMQREHCLALATYSTWTSKQFMANTVQHFTDISTKTCKYFETDAVKCKVGEIATYIFVMESMTYLTAGLVDYYEDQDIDCESLITKIFASEVSQIIAKTCTELIGTEAFDSNHWCSKLSKEALLTSSANGSNNDLKIILALLGVQHAGKTLADSIYKLRNTYENAVTRMKQMWNTYGQEDDAPRLSLHLNFNLHPSLAMHSMALEYAVQRLQYGVEIFLNDHGLESVNKHIDLLRLANCMIDVYAMTACLARASRSYCLGTQFSQDELNMASVFCHSARIRVKNAINEVVEGQKCTLDESLRVVGTTSFVFKEFPIHALTRNY